MLSVTPRLLIEWLIKDFRKIILMFLFFSIISVFYALSIPNKYMSNAVVSSNMTDSKSVGGALSKLGGLASLAGISLGGGQLSPEVLKEMMKSKSFLASFIKKHDLGIDIMAANGFSVEENKLLYNEKIYDKDNKVWVRKINYPQTLVPSDIELVDKFNEFFSINYARKTKLITLSFKFYSPEYSTKILDKLISYFNEYLRDNDIENSSSSIEYLQLQLQEAKYNEVKLALQQIMEEQFKKLAIAKTRKEYALRIIEAPMKPVKKSEPKRALICISITLLGTLLGIIFMWTIRIIRN